MHKSERHHRLVIISSKELRTNELVQIINAGNSDKVNYFSRQYVVKSGSHYVEFEYNGNKVLCLKLDKILGVVSKINSKDSSMNFCTQVYGYIQTAK